jgi:ribosomal protein S18 acetylase RimI-like enzyme
MKSMSKTVRRAIPDDLASIMPLLVAVAGMHIENLPDVFKSPANPYSESEIRDRMEKGEKSVFVSTNSADEVTGVLLCSFQKRQNHPVMKDFRTLWIDEVCIAEAHRRQGYGKLLMDYAVEFARENGCSRVELNVWAFNQNAHDFYVSQGMREQRSVMEYIL